MRPHPGRILRASHLRYVGGPNSKSTGVGLGIRSSGPSSRPLPRIDAEHGNGVGVLIPDVQEGPRRVDVKAARDLPLGIDPALGIELARGRINVKDRNGVSPPVGPIQDLPGRVDADLRTGVGPGRDGDANRTRELGVLGKRRDGLEPDKGTPLRIEAVYPWTYPR